MATLGLKSISKSFGTTKVLHDINLAIEDKEFIAFLGPSGCGKSTLLRIIAGLEAATQGQIIIGGTDVSDAAPVDRDISMVFQSYALYPHLSVYENIAFPLRVQKIPTADLDARVQKTAAILRLSDKLALKPAQLSGGQCQRVAIGRSIVREPRIFLFDEPLSSLDAALRGDMRVELSQLHRDLGATMVYVTHDQVEAMTMADRIVVLNDGRVEQFGTPLELYHHPVTKFVATFIGQPNMNLVPAIVTAIDIAGLHVEIGAANSMVLPVDTTGTKVGDQVEIGIRPEDLKLAGGAGLNVVVNILEHLGSVSIAHGNVVASKTRFCASLDGGIGLQEGDQVAFSVDPAAAHVFDAKGKVLRRLKAPVKSLHRMDIEGKIV